MATIHLRQNIYQGVNAHLHSLAQNPTAGHASIWQTFHTAFIAKIVDALNDVLPLNYVAHSEHSLQVFRAEAGLGPGSTQRPRPDVSIHRKNAGAQSLVGIANDQTPTRVIPLADYWSEPAEVPAVVIYKAEAHELAGQPVTRFELLSASNKYGEAGSLYQQNRRIAMLSGTSLIEIDFLHQIPSSLPGIPAYPMADDAHAYTIAVTDCRPSGQPVSMLVYVLDVDMPLPRQAFIPLADADAVYLDFDAVYQATFVRGRYAGYVDYDLPPRQLASYSQADQSRIQAVMQRAQAAVGPGEA